MFTSRGPLRHHEAGGPAAGNGPALAQFPQTVEGIASLMGRDYLIRRPPFSPEAGEELAALAQDPSDSFAVVLGSGAASAAQVLAPRFKRVIAVTPSP